MFAPHASLRACAVGGGVMFTRPRITDSLTDSPEKADGGVSVEMASALTATCRARLEALLPDAGHAVHHGVRLVVDLAGRVGWIRAPMQ